VTYKWSMRNSDDPMGYCSSCGSGLIGPELIKSDLCPECSDRKKKRKEFLEIDMCPFVEESYDDWGAPV
jgi:predicted RNA-binding Zn-ribbon protein involved in translation (DUF1610 family)